LAKSNYQFAKRQRDLAKKQKKEEKLRRKSETNNSPAAESPEELPADDQTNTLIVSGNSEGTADDNEERKT
jgi:hypothetical protein